MGKLINLIGMKFHRLTVLRMVAGDGKQKQIRWQCLCECGEKTKVLGGNLRYGRTRSCGCSRRNRNRTLKDWTGARFGRLVVLRDAPKHETQGRRLDCVCDCGNAVTVRLKDLRYGQTRSCGCWKKQILEIQRNRGSGKAEFHWECGRCDVVSPPA